MPSYVNRDASDIPSGNHTEYISFNDNSQDWQQTAMIFGRGVIRFLRQDVILGPKKLYDSIFTKPINKKVERKLNKFIRTHRLFWIWSQQIKLIERENEDNSPRRRIIEQRNAETGSVILASQIRQKRIMSFRRLCIKYYKQNKIIIEKKENEFYSESRKEVISEYIEMANNGISGVSETTKILFDYVYNSSGCVHVRNFINQSVLGDELVNSISNNGQMVCQNFWNATQNVVRQVLEPITRLLSFAVNFLGSMPIPVRINDARRETRRELNTLMLEDQNDNDFINTFHQTRDLRHTRRQRVNTGECNIMDNDSPTSVMEVD